MYNIYLHTRARLCVCVGVSACERERGEVMQGNVYEKDEVMHGKLQGKATGSQSA